jgi:hypothetical protein
MSQHALSQEDLPIHMRDDDDSPTSPDHPELHNELVDALDWLKRAGVVSDERPAFSSFFDELVGDNSGENTDTARRAPHAMQKKKLG